MTRDPRAYFPPGESPPLVTLLDGTVRRGCRVVILTGRMLELACCLGLHDRAVSRPALCASLWPDTPLAPASNALKVLVHRLRQLLNDRAAITSTAHGYTFDAAVSTDIRCIATFAKRLDAPELLQSSDLARARDEYRRLCAADIPPALIDRPAGELLAARIESLRHELGRRLRALAGRTSAVIDSLDIAYDLIASDRCDESAWEIAIRAHLARQDRVAALRDFATCTKHLHNELGLAPSPRIRDLIGTIAPSNL